MNQRRRTRVLVWSTIVALLLTAVFGTYPFLATTAPSGASAVAVEGWIPDEVMPEVKAEIDRRGYSTVYTTGTIRPFSYYVDVWGSLEMTSVTRAANRSRSTARAAPAGTRTESAISRRIDPSRRSSSFSNHDAL